ncbi:MAG: AAA family ATPase [Verrucomicrobiota bacterium]|jgi:thymidylate kinase
MTAARTENEGRRHHLALRPLRLPRFAERPPGGPLVVALEGPNGAGKTTLCRALAGFLRVPHFLGTDAAWFSDDFKSRMIRDADWFASAMFFFSGCFEQMRLLRARPEPLVIMDRSLWSTLAVHGAHSVQRLQALLAMLRPVAAQIHVPDFTLVLDASFAACQSRIRGKAAPDRALDQLTATAAFHAREQAFYRWLGHHRPELVFLDADQAGPREVAQKGLALIRQRAPC